MKDIYRRLEQLLTGAELKGGIAEACDDGLQVRQFSCTVGTFKPVTGQHMWQLGLAVSPGPGEQDFLIRSDLSVIEHLPALHGTVDLEGIGPCSYRAFVSGNSIAGVWNCGERAGQLFATVCPHTSASAPERHYTIERASECMHDWWTGDGWSDDFHKAKWYERRPDNGAETGDEGAFSVHYASGHYEGD